MLDGDTPLVLLGYSYGTYMAYECARLLQQRYNQRVAHVVSVAGIPVDQLNSSLTAWPDYPGDTPVQQLQSLLRATNGGVLPEEFNNLDLLGPALIIGVEEGNSIVVLLRLNADLMLCSFVINISWLFWSFRYGTL